MFWNTMIIQKKGTKSIVAFGLFLLLSLQLISHSHAENIATKLPIIDGEYIGTLYVYGVPVSVIMNVSSDTFGVGHQFTLQGSQQDLFIIGGNCNNIESGAYLAEYGLFSQCLGTDMGLMDQVELGGWFTDIGYSGELRLFSSGSDTNIPSLTGIFNLVRR